jgi:hypothetical protein
VHEAEAFLARLDQRETTEASVTSQRAGSSCTSLSLPLFLSPLPSHSLSLFPQPSYTCLFLYYLLSSKKALQFKKQMFFDTSLLQWKSYDTRVPLSHSSKPLPPYDPPMWCLGFCRVPHTWEIRCKALSLGKICCLKIWIPRNTASNFSLFTGIKSWQISLMPQDQGLLYNHPSVKTMRSHVYPSNRWSGTCLIADNVCAGPHLNYWVSESTKLSDVGLA